MSRVRFLVVLLAACTVPDKTAATFDGGVDGGLDAPPGAPPETTLTETPAAFSSEGTARFVFASNLASATFECSVDGEAPEACGSPFTRVLADGSHTFSVRAVAPGGRSDDSPAEHLWMIDTVVPDTTLTKAPPVADNSEMVRFTFTSSETNVAFECSLDGAAFAVCPADGAGVTVLGPLGDGAHSFAVRARDRAGNVDASPAIHAWAIDTSTPDTQLLSGPSGASGSTSATFAFVSPDAGANATFECALDGAAFAGCTSPFTLTDLTMGTHVFAVRVRDAVGNYDPTPATRTWVVDLTPPDTTITDGPSGVVALASAAFTFTASEPDATFECQVDGGAFAACTSPYNLAGLGQGPHAFAVRATDAANNLDATPATRAWTVDTIAPELAFTAAPEPAGTSGPYVVLGFTSSDGALACSLDGVAFAPCASPLALSLPAGAHELRVRATDDAGNATTIARAWTVACAAPTGSGAIALLALDDAGQVLANGAGGVPATLGSDDTVELADPTSVAARFARGLAFNPGEGDHVAWPVALPAASALTLELWARPDALPGSRDLLVSADGRLAIRVAYASVSTVIVRVAIGEAGGALRVASSAPVAAAAWHQILVSVADPTLRLWVDGVRTEVDEVALGTPLALDGLRLGGVGATAYSGVLDELWLADAAITTDAAALARYCPL